MGTKQFGVLGLSLALLFGVRTAQRGEPTVRTRLVKPEGKNSGTAQKLGPTGNPAALSVKDCPSSQVSEFQKTHWWLSRRSPGCSVSLDPVWKEICKMNPAHPSEEELLAENLTEAQFLSHCLGELRSIESMIASVPNPQRTHLGLMTDRAIEAIQVAASEARFLPFGHYLPWPASGSGSGSADADSENVESDDPGVLIFQDVANGSIPRPKYLLVFLIPEMPSEGLDRIVFSNVSTIVAKVSPNRKVIRFAGPNFSGSVAALGELQNGLQAGTCIHAISGSVTNAATQFQSCPTFDVTQTSDSEALCRFVRGARAFGYESNEIAILSEEGTQYGRQGPADTAEQSGICHADEIAKLWVLHFPREISKLRNAYGEEVGKAAAGESAASSGLGMQWQDTEGSRRDDLKMYGGRQTPLSQEAVLSTLSITLKAQGIKALGVLATDPMDEAFLIHSIKRSSPNVRLFIRDPDLLFLRTPDVGSLSGTLLVSNYPLVPQNQFWSSSREENYQSNSNASESSKQNRQDQVEHHLITFPSAFQEGEYDAFVQLLTEAQWVPSDMKRLEWDWPTGMSADQNASKAGSPGAAAQTNYSSPARPLWLAVMGTAAHYPIKVLNYNDINRDGLKLHSLNLGPPQFLPIAFWAFITMLGLLHVLGLWFGQAVPSFFQHDFDLSEKTSAVTLVKLSCHLMAILTIALTQLILGSSFLFFYDSGSRYKAMASCVGAATVFLIAIAGTLLRKLYVLAVQQQGLPHPDVSGKILRPERILRSSVISALIMIAAGGFWCWMTLGVRFDNVFLHFRNLSLSSGVAPALPLTSVLFVFYFGVWAYLRRLSYWKHRYVEMFQLKLDSVVREDFDKHVSGIDACLLGPLANRTWMIAFCVVFVLSIVAFRPWNTLDMVEPSRVSRFALFFFALALFSLLLNWFRFLNIWIHLRKILNHLENLSIRAAFQRLPKQKSLPILQWESSQSSFLLRQVLDRLRALAKADPTAENIKLEADFEARIDALVSHGATRMKIVEQRVVGGSQSTGPLPVPSRRREDHLREARQEMTKIATDLSGRLRAEYWNRGSINMQPDQKPDPAELKYMLAEDIVALPFYAYIRKVINEMRNILFFLGIAISLLFAALHTYVFRADQAIDWWFFGLFASMGLGIVFVVAQLERNALVSRLSDRTPGQLGGNFYLQLLKYGTVPILTIFGSQVPFISNVVLKWVQPALEALH
jgi:hypothetical protein